MQALKLGFAPRVLAEAKRKRNPAQSTLFEHTSEHIWQKRFYDFNVWTERKTHRKTALHASQSSEARISRVP
jgi:hypothetical protein